MPYRADQSAGYSGAGFYQREAFHEKARRKRILRTEYLIEWGNQKGQLVKVQGDFTSCPFVSYNKGNFENEEQKHL